MLMKTIFVNGCFDVLHRGHIELLAHARSLGDRLVVGIDSDQRVASMKGPSRPINNQNDRAFFLKSIRYVDEVKIFDTNKELEDLVKELNPDVMIVGSDWKEKSVVGSQYAKQLNFFEKIPGYSSTDILEKIK